MILKGFFNLRKAMAIIWSKKLTLWFRTYIRRVLTQSWPGEFWRGFLIYAKFTQLSSIHLINKIYTLLSLPLPWNLKTILTLQVRSFFLWVVTIPQISTLHFDGSEVCVVSFVFWNEFSNRKYNNETLLCSIYRYIMSNLTSNPYLLLEK